MSPVHFGLTDREIQLSNRGMDEPVDLNPLFARACAALWGERWQSEAARALVISDRHIRRIAAGGARATPGMIGELHGIAQRRAAELDEIIQELAHASEAAGAKSKR
jgi:hypothetical protein